MAADRPSLPVGQPAAGEPPEHAPTPRVCILLRSRRCRHPPTANPHTRFLQPRDRRPASAERFRRFGRLQSSRRHTLSLFAYATLLHGRPKVTFTASPSGASPPPEIPPPFHTREVLRMPVIHGQNAPHHRQEQQYNHALRSHDRQPPQLRADPQTPTVAPTKRRPPGRALARPSSAIHGRPELTRSPFPSPLPWPTGTASVGQSRLPLTPSGRRRCHHVGAISGTTMARAGTAPTSSPTSPSTPFASQAPATSGRAMSEQPPRPSSSAPQGATSPSLHHHSSAHHYGASLAPPTHAAPLPSSLTEVSPPQARQPHSSIPSSHHRLAPPPSTSVRLTLRHPSHPACAPVGDHAVISTMSRLSSHPTSSAGMVPDCHLSSPISPDHRLPLHRHPPTIPFQTPFARRSRRHRSTRHHMPAPKISKPCPTPVLHIHLLCFENYWYGGCMILVLYGVSCMDIGVWS